MAIDMYEWVKGAATQRKAMPVLSFPGMQLIGTSVDKLVRSGKLQADCMKAIADRYDTLASVSLMDLSVEAEAFGSPVQFSDDEVPTVTGAIVDSPESLEKLKTPKVGDARTGVYVDTIAAATKAIKHVPVLAGAIGPFSLAGRLMDMTEIMVNSMTEPEFVHATLEKTTEFLIPYYRAFRDAGANGIVMAEPAAGLLSPDLIAEFSTPYVKRIIEAVETPSFLVVYHNCGNTLPLIDSVVATGAKMLHFGNAVDMAEILKKVPADRVVLGNVDPAGQFRNGTPASIRATTRAILEKCGRNPNFVISSGCDIPPVSPLENIDSFFAAVKEYREAK